MCNLTDIAQEERRRLDEWDRMVVPQGGPLKRIARAASPPIDEKSRYAGLIQRCLREDAAPGARPPKAAEHDVALRLASRFLERDGATLSRAELKDILGVDNARSLEANLNRLVEHGLVRKVGAEIAPCWPPAESTLLVQHGDGWLLLAPEGPAHAASGDLLRVEVRSKLNAELSVMMVTHRPGGVRSPKTIAERKRVLAGAGEVVEIRLDDESGLEQILVHLAPAKTLGGIPVEPTSREPLAPSAEDLEKGRSLALAHFGEGWLGEHFVYHSNRAPTSPT